MTSGRNLLLGGRIGAGESGGSSPLPLAAGTTIAGYRAAACTIAYCLAHDFAASVAHEQG